MLAEKPVLAITLGVPPAGEPSTPLSQLEAMLADEPNCTLLCSDGTVAHAEVLALASPVLRVALRLDKTVKVRPHLCACLL